MLWTALWMWLVWVGCIMLLRSIASNHHFQSTPSHQVKYIFIAQFFKSYLFRLLVSLILWLEICYVRSVRSVWYTHIYLTLRIYLSRSLSYRRYREENNYLRHIIMYRVRFQIILDLHSIIFPRSRSFSFIGNINYIKYTTLSIHSYRRDIIFYVFTRAPRLAR